MLWKKLELVMVKPTKGNMTNMKRMAGTAMSMSSASVVKARSKSRGMVMASKAPTKPISTFTFNVKE